MRPRIPYFNFYPVDFIRGVRGLTAQEVGIYTMLLCRIYEENGPVEVSPVKLAAYCGCRQSTFEVVFARLCLLGKIDVVNGMFSNERADEEIELRNRVVKSNSTAGKLSAEKRKQNQHKAATPVQRSVNHTDTDTDTDKREAKASLAQQQNQSRFDEFWDAYPHRGGAKKGRKPSEAKYAAIVKAGTSEQDIIDGAKRAALDRQVIDGYARNPETWLNQAGWQDEIQSSQAKPEGKQSAFTRAWQSALSDARLADGPDYGPTVALFSPRG